MLGSTECPITGLCIEMSDFYSVSSPPIPHSVFKEAFTLPTLPSPIFSPEKSGRTILHRSFSLQARKKSRKNEQDSKTTRCKIALANKILIPGIAARKFPAVDVIYSDGRKSKLAIVFDASGVDASKLAVPEGSLVCLSFRANSQAMVDSWSKPFYDAFSESKSVQLYENKMAGLWFGKVKLSSLALSAKVCFRGMLAYRLGTWCPGVFSDG
ncbi:hypothetical protein PVK06_048965 [Gossypium arboreum]|uniref:Uncharacterized protein n=1 Tax=Gossypium arboreum TaxID=29729 RepID=A0ABR0MHA7_GOSAR|nr:hypothetical protein PVK06_048965 [Gossypium arboreum]